MIMSLNLSTWLVLFNQTLAGLAGATDIATIQSLRLTMDRAVDRDLQTGTDTP